MRRLLFLAALAAGCGGAPATPTPAADGAQAAIQQELDQMLVAWNRDDLDAHIAAYADDATWTTPRGLLHGRAAIRDALVKGFQRGNDLVGELSFGPSEFNRLAPDVMMTNGSFKVAGLPGGNDINGVSTLVWKRIGGKWRIVHDHSS